LDDIVAAFDRTYTVVALVPDAPGLAVGSPVWVGGRVVGSVKALGFMPAGTDTLDRIWVDLKLPRGVQSQVRQDSRVRLTSTALIGERVVDIEPGTPSVPALAPGDTLRMKYGLSADEVTRQAASIKAQLDTLLAEARSMEPAARARITQAARAAAAMEGAMVEARRLQADLRANAGMALLDDPAFAASLERVREHAAGLPAAAARLRGEAEGTADVVAALATLEARADTLRASLDAAAQMLDASGGFAGRITRDSALIRAVDAARASLDSLVAEARRNPLRFVF
ncbi:MAG TPA: MlaD family protein, partial [Longimicrobiales bacterium]|nr:MlaD family protein [Longimicrobiales bacterium]